MAQMHRPPLAHMPWGHLRWAQITTAGAKRNTHVNTLASQTTIIHGEKFVAIGYDASDEDDEPSENGYLLRQGAGVFSSRFAFQGSNGNLSNNKNLRFEFFVLPREATL